MLRHRSSDAASPLFTHRRDGNHLRVIDRSLCLPRRKYRSRDRYRASLRAPREAQSVRRGWTGRTFVIYTCARVSARTNRQSPRRDIFIRALAYIPVGFVIAKDLIGEPISTRDTSGSAAVVVKGGVASNLHRARRSIIERETTSNERARRCLPLLVLSGIVPSPADRLGDRRVYLANAIYTCASHSPA